MLCAYAQYSDIILKDYALFFVVFLCLYFCCWNHSNEWWHSLAVALFVNNRVRALFSHTNRLQWSNENDRILLWESLCYSLRSFRLSFISSPINRFNMLNSFLFNSTICFDQKEFIHSEMGKIDLIYMMI